MKTLAQALSPLSHTDAIVVFEALDQYVSNLADYVELTPEDTDAAAKLRDGEALLNRANESIANLAEVKA